MYQEDLDIFYIEEHLFKRKGIKNVFFYNYKIPLTQTVAIRHSNDVPVELCRL